MTEAMNDLAVLMDTSSLAAPREPRTPEAYALATRACDLAVAALEMLPPLSARPTQAERDALALLSFQLVMPAHRAVLAALGDDSL